MRVESRGNPDTGRIAYYVMDGDKELAGPFTTRIAAELWIEERQKGG